MFSRIIVKRAGFEDLVHHNLRVGFRTLRTSHQTMSFYPVLYLCRAYVKAKMAATTINVVNSFTIIFPSYLFFFKKTVSKTRL